VISYILNQVHKFSNYYKKHGYFWVCRHSITNLFHYNGVYIFETAINENHAVVKAKIPVSIRLLTRSKEDINQLTEFWPSDTYILPEGTLDDIREHITRLLSAGDECMIAEYEGKIIHMSWVGFHDTHIFEPYEKKRGIAPGEALSYNIYCAEEYQGNHLMGAVYTDIFNILQKRGYDKLIAYVAPHNTRAVKVHTQFCGKPKEKLYSIKILGVVVRFLRQISDYKQQHYYLL
jgi:hypothetical protein